MVCIALFIFKTKIFLIKLHQPVKIQKVSVIYKYPMLKRINLQIIVKNSSGILYI